MQNNGTAMEDRTFSLSEEDRRVRSVFTGRAESAQTRLDPYSLYVYHELLETLAACLRAVGIHSLAKFKILDVGCGSGGMLWRLQVFGACPSNCYGVDLLRDKLDVAHQVSPNVGFIEGNVARLPFCDAAFDIVFQFVVFTSILDSEIRKTVAAEVSRTLRPGGYFISYDFRYPNPRNPNVRPISVGELKSLFPGWQFSSWRLTLAPPIGRFATQVSPALCRLLALVPFLRSHDLCIARRPTGTSVRLHLVPS